MVILGLGSNIGDRYTHLRDAISQLKRLKSLEIQCISPVYESEALIPPETNAGDAWNVPFLNLAIKAKTNLTPEALLAALKSIEKILQRKETARWYPRNIDIDILAWDDLILSSEHLTIPHANLDQRPFALWPLLDVAPNWVHPEFQKPAAALAQPWGDQFSGNAPLKTKQINASIEEAKLVGILNITPDSFSDGGLCFNPENALLQAKKCVAEGASVLDIGAESTRPNATPITLEEEWQRLLPVIKLIKAELPAVNLSVDTYHPETAEKVLGLGIDFLNDVTGFQKTIMQQLAREADIPIIFMHSLTVPASKTVLIPEDKNPIEVVYHWAQLKIEAFLKQGFRLENLIFDVGIGFGNSPKQAIQLLRHIEVFHALGVKLYVGHSRKSFLNAITDKHCSDRDFETAVISGLLAKKQVHYLRVHNVALSQQAIRLNKHLLNQ